jgi:uncharacterized Zn finger protein
MTIYKKCPKCGAEGICMTVKVGETDVWMDACYHCGTLLLTDEEKNSI